MSSVAERTDLRVVATDLSDEEVVERVLRGNIDLFEILMRRHNQRLYRVVRSILRDDEETEDTLQEVYVRGYTHLNQFLGQARFSTWLTKIAVHEAFRRRKRHQRYTAIEDDGARLESPRAGPERRAFQAELRVLLEDAIDQLPEEFRTVFMLREVEGLSTGETAACLSIPEETVRTRLFRARKQLRENLQESIGETVHDLFSFGFARCDRLVAAVMSRIHRLDSDTQ